MFNDSPSSAKMKVAESAEIKGYLFVFQHERSKELDIQSYLDGRKDEEIQTQFSRPGFKLAQRIYSTLDELISDKKQRGNHPQMDGSCYVLYLNCSADMAHNLIKQGNFHAAIAGHKSFHEILTENKNVSPGKTRVHK
jgi:hypothetical protein